MLPGHLVDLDNDQPVALRKGQRQTGGRAVRLEPAAPKAGSVVVVLVAAVGRGKADVTVLPICNRF